MEVTAKATYIKISPRKLRLLAKDLVGLGVDQALQRLFFYRQEGRVFLEKLIKQAKANAVNNFKLPEDKLFIAKLEVGEGPRAKRIDKSHGARFDRGIIKKKTSHIFITVEEREDKSGTKS